MYELPYNKPPIEYEDELKEELEELDENIASDNSIADNLTFDHAVFLCDEYLSYRKGTFMVQYT